MKIPVLNIGINMLAFVPRISGGIEFYILNLLSALAEIDTENQYYLFLNLDNYHKTDIFQANFHRIKVPIHARPQIRRILCEQLLLPLLDKKLNLDVIHSPSYTFPILSRTPGVVTICDMLYKVHPQVIAWPKLFFWNHFVPLSVRRCREVITISEYSKRDIIKFLGTPDSKITVTPLALDKGFSSIKQHAEEDIARVCGHYGIHRPFILNVGGVGRHKNPIALIRLIKILRERPQTEKVTLVITGNDYGSKKQIEEDISRHCLQNAFVLPGYVSRNDLWALYRGAGAYVSTSTLEGFGLTVLEAMACGTPVVVSNRASLPEIVGNGGLVVNPDDGNELADVVYGVLTNKELREDLIKRGGNRVLDFTWNRTAQLTLDVYRRAAKVIEHGY